MTMMLQRPDSTVRIEVLGEELRRLREACGLTLMEVVSRIGISESYVSRIEKGKRVPSPEAVAALLVIYGVTGEERLEILALAKKAGQPGVNLIWKKSSFTGNANCVEVAHLGIAVAVRDSKDPDGPVLRFPQLPSGPPSIVMATRIMQAPNAE